MGRLPRTAALAALLSIGNAGAQVPDGVLGTFDGEYAVFTPSAVAAAADSGIAFRFFAHEVLTVPAISTDTAIAASGPGLALPLLAQRTYSAGLTGGPFFTAYEGFIEIGLKASATLNLALTAVHVFEDGTRLSTTRNHTFRANSKNEVHVTLTGFSSITELPIGATFTNDAGETVTITEALLAQPVGIALAGELTALAGGARTTATVESLSAETPAVTFYQFQPGHGHAGGGAATPLSDADPSPTGPAPVPGLSTSASRGDHIHVVTFSALPPKAPGTASPGSGSVPAPWDHVHPVQPLSSFGTVGINGTCAKSDGSGGLKYADCGSPRVLSNRLPKIEGTAAPGTGTGVSREDHVHPAAGGTPTPLSNANPAPTGAAPTPGTSASAARGDHVHQPGLVVLAPKPPGTASAGSGSLPGPWDHVHPRQPLSSFGTVGIGGTCAKANASRTGLAYGDCGSPRALSNRLPKIEGTAAPGTGTGVSREDHVHPATSGFVEMLSGQWTLRDNNVDYTISNAALHNFLKADDAPKLMHFIFRYSSGGVNYAYLLNCAGADTPLGAAESRAFQCFGWRERTSQGIAGEIIVAPSSYRIKVSNIDARDNTRVNFKLWGLR